MKGDSAKGQALRRPTPKVRPVTDIRAAVLALGTDAKRVLSGLPQVNVLPTTAS